MGLTRLGPARSYIYWMFMIFGLKWQRERERVCVRMYDSVDTSLNIRLRRVFFSSLNWEWGMVAILSVYFSSDIACALTRTTDLAWYVDDLHFESFYDMAIFVHFSLIFFSRCRWPRRRKLLLLAVFPSVLVILILCVWYAIVDVRLHQLST